MDISQITVETARLRLVPATSKYAEDVFREYRDPVTLYMNWPPPESLQILKERMQRRESELAQGNSLLMAVLLKKSAEFLGCFSLDDLDKKSPELGGWLKQSAHGNRYGQEAAGALKQWADAHLAYDHLVWPCAALNVASRKVAESLGGKVQKEYEKTTAGGRVWAYVEYWIFR